MDSPGMRRRAILTALGAAGVGGLAGCTDGGGEPGTTEPGQQPETSAETETETTSSRSKTTAESTEEESSDETESYDLYVDPDGSDENQGTADEPLGSVGTAVQQAEPGETVHVNAGEYQEYVEVREGGTADAPIEVTGPPDAVLRRPAESPAAMLIGGDHFHVTGLTIDGLADPDRPDDPEAYGNAPLVVFTAKAADSFNRGGVFAPHGIGNSGRQLVKLRLVADAEVGPFRVTGRAGAKWQLTDENNHNGELVYVGTAPATVEKFGWEEWDQTHDVRVHHVDNSAGHPHSQLVDVKPGSENVTIEYCTDGGGSQNDEEWDVRSVALRGHACIVRWNRLQNGEGDGIGVGSVPASEPENDLQERAGDDNEIYGNVITGFGGQSISFPHKADDHGQGPADQAILCGNEVDGPVDGDPGKQCPSDVPEGDGVGHRGGDSPWA